MPIKDWSKYPPDWKTVIRPAILERAGNCCEECGVKNYDIGYRDASGKFYSAETIMNLLEEDGYDIFANELINVADADKYKPIKIVLTIAHLDHDVTNNDYSNLMALCQLHHLRLDVPHHKKNARETLNKKKKLQSLF
jgi:hypothetical protein